jgi:ABC-type transport system involved in multi-copper enzyme maturation permease subunit
MSTAIEVEAVNPAIKQTDWALWLRQIRAIMRVELWKNFWGRRSLLLYLLAALPVVIMMILALFDTDGGADIRRFWPNAQKAFGYIYGALILRTVVFFGCAWIFMNLFRGEIVDKSLHYYFLCALRREVLVAGKYLSGLLATVVLFSLTTGGSLFFLYYARGYPANYTYIFDGPGLGQILTYQGITVLACLGYGAVFLLIGLFFRNPIFPALAVYGWDWINFLLPPMLKKISIIHYLHTLSPVPLDEGPLATVASTTSPWVSVPSLLVFTGLVLWFAARRIRRLEINYGNE